MPKKTKGIKINAKEEKLISKYLPYGIMAGIIIGCIASMLLEDVIYILYGICGGLVLSVLIGSFAAEKKK